VRTAQTVFILLNIGRANLLSQGVIAGPCYRTERLFRYQDPKENYTEHIRWNGHKWLERYRERPPERNPHTDETMFIACDLFRRWLALKSGAFSPVSEQRNPPQGLPNLPTNLSAAGSAVSFDMRGRPTRWNLPGFRARELSRRD